MTMTIMPQGRQRYYDNLGLVAAGCLLYTYAAGTTNPKTAYQDAAGTVPHPNPIPLDAKGEAVIYFSGSYKIDLKTAAGVQITGWPVDNLTAPFIPSDLSDSAGSGLLGFLYAAAYGAGSIGRWLQDLALSTGSSFIGFVQSGVGAVLRTLQAKARDSVNAADFGAVGDGVTDDRAAIQKAIAAVRAGGGGTVWLNNFGRFKINPVASPDGMQNGLLIPYNSAHGTANRVFLRGAGASTVLLAGGDSMAIVRYSDSHGGVSDLAFDANGHTGVTHLAVCPEDTNQTATNVYTIFNVFKNLYMTGGAEGIYLTYGPKVAGSDSGCYLNRFDNISIYSCLRGINAPTRPAAFSGGVGRNLFSNIRIGQNCNTGIEMRAGGTNTFLHVNLEGISLGATPNAIPTAIIVAGVGNDSNSFVGCNIESCTRHIEHNTTYTYWTNGSFDSSLCLFTQPLRTIVADNIFTKGYFGAGGSMTPVAPFQCVTPNGADVRLANVSAGSTYWQMIGAANSTVTYDSANAGGEHRWLVNAAERARINSVGYFKASNTGVYNSTAGTYHELAGSENIASLVVKSTCPASQSGAGGNIISTFSIVQTGANLFRGENGGVATFLVNANGNCTNTSNSYGAISDAKLKQDVVDAGSQWADIKALRIRKYHLKADPTGPLHIGLVAQEAEKVSPGLIGEDDDFEVTEKTRKVKRTVRLMDDEGKPVIGDDGGHVIKEVSIDEPYRDARPLGTKTKNVKYSLVYLKAVKALQEAMERIEALEATVATLKGK